MFCPSCQAALAANAWFCHRCGEQIVTATEHAIDSSVIDPVDDTGEASRTNTLAIEEGELVERRLRVRVLSGPDQGLEVVTSGGSTLIGTHERAGVRLTDPAVSRTHAELRVISNGLLLIDRGSKNGTRIGDVSIREAPLPLNGIFWLAGSELQASVEVDHFFGGTQRLPGFESNDPKLCKSLELLGQVAGSDSTVLLEGETGTGKEVLARALHAASARAGAPFVVVDCGAASPTLLDDQLFGHVEGAFTDARGARPGAFELARGGTVFLDELGELPLELQPRLLRVLESRTIRRLGEVEDRAVDVRIIAATNRRLRDEVRRGAFRADLYYRAAVVCVDIPPLRERRADIALLARLFAGRFNDGGLSLSIAAEAALCAYDWPGNARELRNVIERAAAVCRGPQINPDHIFPDQGPADEDAVTFSAAKARWVQSFEGRYATSLIERNGGNLSQAAKEAGLSRPSLYALLKRAGIPVGER